MPTCLKALKMYQRGILVPIFDAKLDFHAVFIGRKLLLRWHLSYRSAPLMHKIWLTFDAIFCRRHRSDCLQLWFAAISRWSLGRIFHWKWHELEVSIWLGYELLEVAWQFVFLYPLSFCLLIHSLSPRNAVMGTHSFIHCVFIDLFRLIVHLFLFSQILQVGQLCN